MKDQKLGKSNIVDKVFDNRVLPGHGGEPFLSLRSFRGMHVD
jgi:hypothetical protein